MEAQKQAPVHEGTGHACSLSAIGVLWACRPRHPWSGRQGALHPARPEPCPLVRKPHQLLRATPSHRSATQLAGIASKLHCSSAAGARAATVLARVRPSRGCFLAFCSTSASLRNAALPPCASTSQLSRQPSAAALPPATRPVSLSTQSFRIIPTRATASTLPPQTSL